MFSICQTIKPRWLSSTKLTVLCAFVPFFLLSLLMFLIEEIYSSKQKDVLVVKPLEEKSLDFFFPTSASNFLPGL